MCVYLRTEHNSVILQMRTKSHPRRRSHGSWCLRNITAWGFNSNRKWVYISIWIEYMKHILSNVAGCKVKEQTSVSNLSDLWPLPLKHVGAVCGEAAAEICYYIQSPTKLFLVFHFYNTGNNVVVAPCWVELQPRRHLRI